MTPHYESVREGDRLIVGILAFLVVLAVILIVGNVVNPRSMEDIFCRIQGGVPGTEELQYPFVASCTYSNE